jgi:hypothetical protein
MKVYCLISVDTPDGTLITWHRRLYFTQEDAFEEAHKHPNTAVMVLQQVDSFSPEQITNIMRLQELEKLESK